MSFSVQMTLTPDDLIASRTLFSKIFQGLFHFTSLNFYFPESPQSALNWKEGGNLEEFIGINWNDQKEIYHDPERKRLFWPLVFHGKSLGFLVLFGLSQGLEAREHQLLERLSGLALDMAALKKQIQLDPVTGLYHEGAFRKIIIQELKQWTKTGGEGKPKKLSLAESATGRSLILGFLSFQPKRSRSNAVSASPETDWRTWVKDITKAFPAGTIFAAIDHHPLTIGLVIPISKEIGPSTSPTFQPSSEIEQKFTYHLGWSGLDPHNQEGFQGSPSTYSLMTRWWEQAWTALHLAQDTGKPSLGYHEILYRAGRVLDLLPSHRLVINLGQKAGVSSFMRFSILEEGDPVREKGLVIPLDIQEDVCIAEAIYLHETGRTIQKNDSVRLVSSFSEKMEESGKAILLLKEPLHSFQMFQQKLREATKALEQFSLLIGRLDDYADRLRLWGEQSLLEIQKEMNAHLEARLPDGGLIGPYGRDGFILFIPEINKQEAEVWARDLMAHLKQSLNLSLSFALSDYPNPPFHKGESLDNTIKALDHLSFLGPGSLVAFDSVSLNISGDKLYNLGDLNGAVWEYEKALILDPSNINVLNSLGVCYANLGQQDRAIDSFLKVLALSADDFMASFNLGFAYVRLGMAEKAQALWENLAQKNGAPFDLAYHLGRLYKEQGNFSQALTWFKKAEESPERKGFIYRLLGESEEALGKTKEAMAFFKKALKINPQDALSLSHLGALYLQHGESIKVALSLCQQATRIEPAKGLYWINLGKALLMNDFPQRAVNALHQALSQGEQNKAVYRLLGLSFRTLGLLKESEDYFIEALKRDPDDAEIQGFLNEKKIEERP